MRPLLLAALVAAAFSGQAMAGSPSAVLTVTDGNHTWTENLAEAGLLDFDSATGNFVMKQGSTLGEWVTTDNVDFWQWQGDGWMWHSAETASGLSLSIEEQLAYTNQANDPWASVAKITTLSGHGDPDLSYGYYARNNTGAIQTYTFTVGETIVPPVDSPAAVYADIAYSLTNPSGSLSIAPAGSATAIQHFMLSADNGLTFTSAGVDVGPAVTTGATGSTAWGPYSASAGAPTGSWNYMQIVTAFTLTPGRDVASLSGYASIVPVPEPETYAMFLAGLGLLAAIARRRKAG